MQKTPIAATIPLPLQIVIDDVGWWCGADGHERQEPYRTGIDRDHVPADYAAIVELGRRLGMRPQAAMILCEWDRRNILRGLPDSTWMGKNWDNSRYVGPWYERALSIIRENRDYIEITLHGVGHEFWQDGVFTRAEWHDRNGQMRPANAIRAHLDAFLELWDEHDFGPHPTSFVPCAFCHTFGPTVSGSTTAGSTASGSSASGSSASGGEDENENFASIARDYGIDFISTPFSCMHGRAHVTGAFGFDHGIMTVDRGADLLNWHIIGEGPPPGKHVTGPICGMHWPNILHPDPARNLEIVELWVQHLSPYNDLLDRTLSPNTAAFRTQLAHRETTKLKVEPGHIELDFSGFNRLPAPVGYFQDEFVVKVEHDSPLEFTAEGAAISNVEARQVGGKWQARLGVRQKRTDSLIVKW